MFRLFIIFFLISSFKVQASKKESLVCQNLGGTGLNESIVLKYKEKLLLIIKQKDKKKLADELRYPFRLRVNKKVTKVKNANEMKKKYLIHLKLDHIQKALLAPPKKNVCNFQGVGFYNGRVWVMAEKYYENKNSLKIVAINGL